MATAAKKASIKKPSKPTNTAAAAKEELGIVPAWTDFAQLKSLRFGVLCEKYQTLKDEVAFRKAKMDDLEAEIEAALIQAGTEKVAWEDRPVQIITKSGQKKIDGTKLLEQGVSPEQIVAATVEGEGYSYVLMGKAKKK